jgi:hypothetical protein
MVETVETVETTTSQQFTTSLTASQPWAEGVFLCPVSVHKPRLSACQRGSSPSHGTFWDAIRYQSTVKRPFEEYLLICALPFVNFVNKK